MWPAVSHPSRPLTAFLPTQYTEMNPSVVYITNISVHIHALLFVIRAALLYLRRPNNQIFISVFPIHRLNNIFLFIHLEERTQAQRSRLVQTNEAIKGAGHGKRWGLLARTAAGLLRPLLAKKLMCTELNSNLVICCQQINNNQKRMFLKLLWWEAFNAVVHMSNNIMLQ